MNWRRPLIVVLLVIVAASIAWIWNWQRLESQRVPIRNVVLISIDTCRADHLGCYHQGRQTSPHIDRIAQDGVMFVNAHSTNPVTLPAHCSLLTGTTPPFHRVRDNINYRLGDSNDTLAEILREDDFQTAAFVGAFMLDSNFGLDQGFDTYNDDMRGSNASSIDSQPNERTAGQVNRAATAWLEAHHEEPFFLFLHYYDPHAFYGPPEPFASQYANDPYAGEIAYTDRCVGQLISMLKAKGIYDSTLIIITSDHGESLNEHGEKTHSYFIYQSTIRIPFIMKVPGGPQGKKVQCPVSITDVLPTVLGLLGKEVPRHVQGVDLSADLFTDTAPERERFIYMESLYPTKYECNPLFGLVNGRWKYIWTTNPELYDVRSDSMETANVVKDHVEFARQLQDHLKMMLAEQSPTDAGDQIQPTDTETMQRLRSLGYIGGGRLNEVDQIDPNAEDPKEFVQVNEHLMSAWGSFNDNRFAMAREKCLEIISERPKVLAPYVILGRIARRQGRHADAVSHFSEYLAIAASKKGLTDEGKVVRFDNSMADVHVQLAGALLSVGRVEEAIGHFQLALETEIAPTDDLSNLDAREQQTGSPPKLSNDPSHTTKTVDSREYFARGLALMHQGHSESARENFTKSGQRNQKVVYFMNNLAWTLATHHDSAIRKPDQAMLLAEIVASLTQRRNSMFLDTLAAAYAAAGQFDEAIRVMQHVIDRASAVGDVDAANLFRQRLESYQQSTPFRERTGTSPPD